MREKSNIWLRSFALVLGCLLLISTVGPTVDIHFCKGDIKSIGIFASAESCGSNDVDACLKDSGNEKREGFSKIPCCFNQTLSSHQEIENYENKLLRAEIQKSFAGSILLYKPSLQLGLEISQVVKPDPPSPTSDLYILFQDLLI